MKKTIVTILIVALALTSVFANGTQETKGATELTIAEKIAEAEGLTTEQLIEKAAAETGDFVAYGNTSRLVTAMEGFVKKYGAQIGLTAEQAIGSKQNDSAIYTLLTTESVQKDKSSKVASMALIQDSATLQTYIDSTTMFANYVPYGLKDSVDAKDLVPLAQQYCSKIFLYNNVGNAPLKISNVWELTDSKYAGKVFFKNPANEIVNMNFLIMLTKQDWADKLEKAYIALNGKAATDVGAGKTYENYGYKWIAEFLKNANFSISSDTTIAQDLSKPENAGKAGLFTYSKLRDKSCLKDNLTAAALDKPAADGTFTTVDPFSGFMYAIYAQIATAGPRPYTAMLFINYLMTDEGFAPWLEYAGSYSPNPANSAYDGDQPYSFWKNCLVIEDGAYISSVKAKVADFINIVVTSK